jgi:hypothetical protein
MAPPFWNTGLCSEKAMVTSNARSNGPSPEDRRPSAGRFPLLGA